MTISLLSEVRKAILSNGHKYPLKHYKLYWKLIRPFAGTVLSLRIFDANIRRWLWTVPEGVGMRLNFFEVLVTLKVETGIGTNDNV